MARPALIRPPPSSKVPGMRPWVGVWREAALFATLLLLVMFATPLSHVTGVLLVAGFLLISRRLATRTMLGLVDRERVYDLFEAVMAGRGLRVRGTDAGGW